MASPKRARRSEGDGRDYDSSRRRSSDDDRRASRAGRDSDRDERHDRHDRHRSRGEERARSADRERHRDRDRPRSAERERTRDRDGGAADKPRNGSGELKKQEELVPKEFKEPRSVEQVFKKERRDRDEVEDLSRKRIKEPLDKENEAGEEAAEVSPKKQDKSIALMEEAEAALEAKEQAKEKEKASFEYTGNLAAETNKVGGVALQFTEPPEARQPTVRWRLYVFKDGAPLDDPLFIHRQSCYLFGRERKIADIPIDHPSCSKQHAVIQYRLIEKEVDDGRMSKRIRPYVMDLGSTNKTFLNGEAIEPQRYYELFEKDTLKFGNSSREYVLLHENSA